MKNVVKVNPNQICTYTEMLSVWSTLPVSVLSLVSRQVDFVLLFLLHEPLCVLEFMVLFQDNQEVDLRVHH